MAAIDDLKTTVAQVVDKMAHEDSVSTLLAQEKAAHAATKASLDAANMLIIQHDTEMGQLKQQLQAALAS
jgi:hypothetical protein